ncbi:MAG: enolase C-terminal domain-like protein [Deinococcales bacterium]
MSDRIAKVYCQTFELAMKGSLRWGKASELSKLKHQLIIMESEGGLKAVAEAPVRPTIYGETLESIAAIVDYLRPSLIGLACDDVGVIQSILKSVKNNHTARGALDIAFHQLCAKAKGLDFFKHYLGPNQRLQVSYILGISEAETMMAEAREVFSQGVRVFKIKIGRDAKHDKAIVESLRHEFGNQVILYADANESLSVKEVGGRLEHLAHLNIAYVEEPLPVHLIKARAKLKQEAILPIIADDSCFSPEDLSRELDFDTFDILNIKTARTGFSDSLKMLDMAKKADKGIMLGSQASSGLGTLHCALIASQAGVDYPSELSFPLKLRGDSIKPELRYHEGYLNLADYTQTSLNLSFSAFNDNA